MAYVPPIGLPLDEIRAELNRIRHPVRIAIRRSKNPFNVGSIIRTSHSFLVKEVILIGTEDWYERAAMGMQRFENVREVQSEAAFIALAKSEGWFLSVLEKDDAQVGLWDSKLPEDAVIVVGNEEDGVGPEILRAVTAAKDSEDRVQGEVIAIPMFGINHSYPMTVASGMALAEWARRRYACGENRVVLTPRTDR